MLPGEEGKEHCLLTKKVVFFGGGDVTICYMTFMKPCHLREVAIPFPEEISHKLRWYCQALLQDFPMAPGYGTGIQSIGDRKQLL